MKEVFVYSRSTCAPCKTLKVWLTRKGIAYTELNVDDPAVEDELLGFTGMVLLPTVVIGDKIIKGLNISQINQALQNA